MDWRFIMASMYKTRMSANLDALKGAIEETHTREEIIHYAQEVLAKEMGLDLCSFVGLEEAEIREDDGDRVYYVNESGNPVEFTEEMKFKAAVAVLNSNGHIFEATPVQVQDVSSGFSGYV
jgi:hypothetical protein